MLQPDPVAITRKALWVAILATAGLAVVSLYFSHGMGADADPWGDLWAFVLLPAVAGYLIGYLLGASARNHR